MLHEEVTYQIINAFYTVYNSLGYGFLEKVYENSMVIEIGKKGLHVSQQVPIKVCYEGLVVGEDFADLLVEKCVIVEVKAVENILDQHKEQLINYLKATEFEIGLLINFGPEAKNIRKIFTNDRKKHLSMKPLNKESVKIP